MYCICMVWIGCTVLAMHVSYAYALMDICVHSVRSGQHVRSRGTFKMRYSTIGVKHSNITVSYRKATM